MSAGAITSSDASPTPESTRPTSSSAKERTPGAPESAATSAAAHQPSSPTAMSAKGGCRCTACPNHTAAAAYPAMKAEESRPR